MSLADEYNRAPSPLSAASQAGLDAVSSHQKVEFRQYRKIVFAVDGTVFYAPTTTVVTVVGSLHYSTERQQDDDQTVAANAVIFSAQSEIVEFNIADPQILWVGEWDLQQGTIGQTAIGGPITLKVVFSGRGAFYEQVSNWYYTGYAVYPAMESQFIDSEADLPEGPIVSNSLPIWLAQNAMAPVYPSFLVPDNVRPPYIVAHIDQDKTTAIGGFPIYSDPVPSGFNTYEFSDSQLMKDEVRLTLYGFTNQMARQYYNSLIQYSLNTDDFGFMNAPAIRDAKRTQVEIAALAQKKVIDIEASYYSGTVNAIARGYILSATIEIVL